MSYMKDQLLTAIDAGATLPSWPPCATVPPRTPLGTVPAGPRQHWPYAVWMRVGLIRWYGRRSRRPAVRTLRQRGALITLSPMHLCHHGSFSIPPKMRKAAKGKWFYHFIFLLFMLLYLC